MKKIAIVGFGELGQQFFEIFNVNSSVAEFAFFDDLLFDKKIKDAYPFNDFKKDHFAHYDFYIALGYKNLNNKSQIIEELLHLKRNLPKFIHSTSFVNSTAQIGENTFLYPMCNIDKGVCIGKGVLLNNSVTISHNNTIGDCCYLSPGVITSGFVEIGEKTFIGSGAIISNKIKIGKNVKIGIGSVVTCDIPDGCSAIGNPAVILKGELRLL